MMKDYSKLSDLNGHEKYNPHTFLSQTNQPSNDDDPFLPMNSPSSLGAIGRPKLATIHEQQAGLFRSKSTTEIKMNNDRFDDDFKVKFEDAKSCDLSNLADFKMRRESSNSEVDFQNLEKSFLCNNHMPSTSIEQSSGRTSDNSQSIDGPFLIKTPTRSKHRTLQKRPKEQKELAVDIRNVSYQYGVGKKATKVLNEITVSVPLGGIYGLLGPSGCGKTSLLKIVVGMNKAEGGLVRLFGTAPGKNSFIPGPGVGYMPQDISLFQDLTVAETLVFYSKIYRMKPAGVAARIEFLLKLLHLEQKGDRLVKQLSGGQKRRVSLAAALVHSPPLVILDEPTVGVDPLLRQQIWEHLVRLADEAALTVIITTHYIEEARQANTVGLMRYGRILVESNPEKLMLKYHENNLEDVFLKLCMLDQKELVQNADSDDDDEDSFKSQIKFAADGVHYSTTPKETSTDENSEKSTADEVPRVVVSDYSLPLSPHMVHDKENDNFHKGSTYKKYKHTTPKSKDKMRSPLSPLEPVDKSNRNNRTSEDHLKVQCGRERIDSNSSLGSSIIEYDSTSSKVSSDGTIKMATFKREFKQSFEPKTSFSDNFKAFTHKVGALFYKNITLLSRNIPLLLFQFFLPSLEIILFGVCIGADPFDLPVAIFNQDTSGHLPQQFLNALDNHTIQQVHYPTLSLAVQAVRNGDAWGAIAFKHNFSTSLGERHLFGLHAENDTIDHSSVYVFLDMTNQLIGYKLQRTLYETFQKFSKDLVIESGSNPASVELPIKVGKPIYGDKEPTFTEFMAPGVVLTIAFLATVALTALAFVMERKDGIMERILVSGVTPFEFLMSHVVTQLCVIVVQVALLLIFTFLVFDIPSRGPFIWVILLTMSQAICGMEYGLLISSLCETETAATMMALASFYPNLLLSGTVWPTQAMPVAMRYFSYLLPQTIPIEAMRYILSRGWDPINHSVVTLGFGITIIWTIVFALLTMIAFRRVV